MATNDIVQYMWSIMTQEQKALVGAKAAIGTTDTKMNAGNAAARNASSTNKRRSTTKGRSAAKAKTISGSNNVALLRYFQDHPTATYTADQIAQNSPFRGWRPQEIGTALSRLTKLKALQKSGNGWSLTRTGASITELNPRQQVRATKKTAPLTLAATG